MAKDGESVAGKDFMLVDSDIHSLIWFEGISGWATAGGEFVKLMDEYDTTFWVAK